ncbi:MAG: hypothetical protein V3S11_04840 [Elusimicrobiota bacterium]
MSEENSNRLIVLGVLLALISTGLIGLLVIIGPRRGGTPRASRDARAPAASSVFESNKRFDRLQANLTGRRFSRRERGSALDDLPKLERLAPGGRTPAGAARGAGRRGGSLRRLMRRAERFYFRLKKSARFRNAKGLRAFRKDFLSHRDLLLINAKYEVDRDPIKFIRGALKSPHVGALVRKHINQPDVNAFTSRMMSSPDVMKASKSLIKEHHLQKDIDNLRVPGIGSKNELSEKYRAGKMGSTADTMKSLGYDPDMLDVNKMLRRTEKGAPPAVRRGERL